MSMTVEHRNQVQCTFRRKVLNSQERTHSFQARFQCSVRHQMKDFYSIYTQEKKN